MVHQPSSLKILAIGSPLSELAACVAKITAINAKHGPFDACVLVGDAFREGSDGTEVAGVRFPVPTYFTLGKYELPGSVQAKITETGGEVVDNLVFLGKSTVLTTAQGLKIGCIGGAYDEGLYSSGQDTASITEPIERHLSDEQGPFSPILSKPSVDAFLANSIFNPSSEPSLASARESAVSLPLAFHGIDLLLTSSPPPSLSLLSPSAASLPFSLAQPASPLSDAVQKSRPRYVFWGEGEGFWEREPFGWAGDDGQDERWTRAVKLGALGGEEPQGVKKARWFYAFTLPAQAPAAPLPTKPANATPNPFVMREQARHDAASPGRKRHAIADDEEVENGDTSKRARTDRGEPPESYVCKACGTPGHWIQECPSRPERDMSKPPPGYQCNICHSSEHYIRECPERGELRNGKKPPSGYTCRACGAAEAHFFRDCPQVADKKQNRGRGKKELGPEECWFCLSNPKVTKHLITAIGQETYVTLPKGQLIPTTPSHIAQGGSKPLVPGGGHVLIIPIAHHPTLLSIPAEDATSIISEVESYKASLRSCFEHYGAVPVVWEVGRLSGRGGHAHVQIVPIPKALASKVATSFQKAGESQGIDWEANPEEALATAGNHGNYFKVECPDGTTMVHLLKGNFDLQFGRMVIGSLLGYHHRIDWKECGQAEQEEKEDAQKFKKAFAPYHK